MKHRTLGDAVLALHRAEVASTGDGRGATAEFTTHTHGAGHEDRQASPMCVVCYFIANRAR